MVRGFISFLGREISGLHEAAYLLGVFAISSQVLALLRDRLLAHNFGAGTTLDLYYAAFRIPDFMFAVVASFFSASILIPFFSEKIRAGTESGKGVAVGREFMSAMFSVFLITMVVISALVFFFIPWLVPYIFPGFAAAPYRGEVVMLTRILLLSPIFLGLSNLLATVTQFYNRFFIYGISPLLYNLGIIGGVVFLAPKMGPTGLVLGVVIGAFAHFAFQVPFVVSRGLMPRLVFSVKKYWAIMGVLLVAFPRTLALSAQEVSEFFLISLASLMTAGSISVFNLSFNLQSVPLSVIGVSYSMAAFPAMSALFVSGEKEKYFKLLKTTASYIIFLSVPLIALFVVLRAHIVRVILGSGQFSWADTRLTAAALALFVISLAAQGLILLFTRARYAAGNTKTPFYINLVLALVTILGAAFLSKFVAVFPGFQSFIETIFRVRGIPGTSVLVLPLAFSVSSLLAATAHIYTFERDFKAGIARALARLTAQIVLVSVAMGVVTYLVLNLVQSFFSLNTFIGVFSQGFIAGLAGILCGMILLGLLGSPEFKDILKALHHRYRKFWRTPVIGPDPGPGRM